MTARGAVALLLLLTGSLAAAVGSGSGDIAGAPPPIPSWVHGVSRMGFATPGETEAAGRAGMQVFHTNLVWPYARLASAEGGGLSPGDAAALKKLVAGCRAAGMRLVLGLPPFPPVELVRLHPEWRVLPARGATLPEPREADLGTRIGCNNGPWGDYLIEVCAELVRDDGVDGFSFDGNYHPPLCWCPACDTAYRQTGRTLPERINLDEPAYRDYLILRGERLYEHYLKLQRRLKSIRPDAVVMSWSVNAGRYGQLLSTPRSMPISVNRLFDLPMQEWWLDETNLGASVAPSFGAAYLRALSRGPCASEPYLMSRGRPYGTDSFPAHERMVRTLLALSQGNVTAQSLGWPGHRESTAESLAAVKARERWTLGATNDPWGAILVSESTRQFVAYRDIGERFLPHVFGAYRMARETRLPVALLSEEDLTPEALRAFKVLLLPNSVALSDFQQRTLQEWVDGGGGLVATSDTGWCDERGIVRERPEWERLLGIVRRAPAASGSAVLPEPFWRSREQIGMLSWTAGGAIDTPALRRLVSTPAVRFRAPVTAFEARPGTEVLVRRESESGVPQPALVIRRQGAGRVVYLGVALDAALWSYAYPYQRELLKRCVELAASTPPAVTVEAPMCVEATHWRVGSSRVLHLFNGVNTTGGHGKPAEETPLREESIPVHGIRVRYRERTQRVRIEPGGVRVRLRPVNGEWVADLPPLAVHSMVIREP